MNNRQRMELLEQAQTMAFLYRRPDDKKSEFRLSYCGRAKSLTGQKVLCASVWGCPICWSIARWRHSRLCVEALGAIQKGGGAAYRVTFTVSHSKTDKLQDLLSRFKSAQNKMRKSRSFRKITETMIGFAYGFDITWGGLNGWHPHMHQMWLFPDQTNSAALLLERLFPIWEKFCLDEGLNTALPHGLNVLEISTVGEYVAAFNRERKPIAGHLTVWELTRAAFVNGADSSERRRWIEYLRATKGLHCFTFRASMQHDNREGKNRRGKYETEAVSDGGRGAAISPSDGRL